MEKLPEIKAAYDWFFAQYVTEVEERTRNNDFAGIDQMGARRDMLERGFLVLMFGQFEIAVNSAFEKAVNARASNPDWTRGAAGTFFQKARKCPSIQSWQWFWIAVHPHSGLFCKHMRYVIIVPTEKR